jgi:hypothetical protein
MVQMRAAAKTRGSSSRAGKRTRAVGQKRKPGTTELSENHVVVVPERSSWNILSRARSLVFEEGLNLLVVGRLGVSSAVDAVSTLRAIHVSASPAPLLDPVEIVSPLDVLPGWLGAEGGTIIVNAPSGGGSALLTVYGVAQDAALPSVRVVNLQNPANLERALALPGTGIAAAGDRELNVELVLHIERQGDRREMARGWVGNPGQELRVEGFAVRALEVLNPGDIEYMGFGLGGRQTPWMTGTDLCGTRGRGLPLTGFAVRLAQGVSDRFDVIYEGYFFRGGANGPVRNGEPCLSSITDDSLSAVRLRVVERPSG